MNPTSLCIRCKGRGFCGKPCPFLSKLSPFKRNFSDSFAGTSPPAVFVGRFNYPHVQAGILAPTEERDDAWQLDSPHHWAQERYDVAKIVESRTSLLNSRFTIDVKNPEKTFEVFRETALASNNLEMEIKTRGKVREKISFDRTLTAMGPSLELVSAKVTENPKVPRRVEKTVSDELRAAEAVEHLYAGGIDEYHIQRLLSAGLLGIRKKIVPTRWAITAVDTMLSSIFESQVRDSSLVDSIELYHSKYLDNDFHVLLLPTAFAFEQVEAYTPGSVWQKSKEVQIISDYESSFGRKSYASNVAGAYYAAKFVILEHLAKRRRQAAALILRSIGPGYFVALGVWQVRENVKLALANKPQTFSTVKELLLHLHGTSRFSENQILENSRLLKHFRTQKTLLSF